jgi:peptidoglycan/xylan/chitin deacetylase (PgdA/CDA1 family)
MVSGIQHLIRTADAAVAGAYLALCREKNALMSFLFHSLFASEQDIARNQIDPLDRTTTRQLRKLIRYYLAHGYKFVTPGDVVRGLRADGKYALISFDDGYFNNHLALPILEEFGVPAVFFIATDNVRQGKCFWWDVLHREMMRRGASERKIYREGVRLKKLPTEAIEEELAERFGANAFAPRGDIDRPMTAAELRAFAKHPCVRIGNHTANHAILTNYSQSEARRQISRAQEWLGETLGEAPEAIAYPNGGHDAAVVKSCRELGLKAGFTVRPEKAELPIEPGSEAMFRIGRFTPHADGEMITQCRTYRSDVLIYGRFRDVYLKTRRNKVRQ